MKDLCVKSGRLYLKKGDCAVELSVVQCFPWSSPGEYLSLKDKEGEELVFLQNLTALSEDVCFVVKQKLNFAEFTFQINKINSIKDEFELRQYDVNCLQGNRVFYTKLDEYPKTHLGKVSIVDLDGDIYQLDSLGNLDLSSMKRISHLID